MAAQPRHSWGPRPVVRPLIRRPDKDSWAHAERMQREGYGFEAISNLTTLRYAVPARETMPLRHPTPPLIELPRIPRVEIQSADFWWSCDLPGCPRGWHGEQDGTFWTPKYVKIYADDGATLADLRYGCCTQHAQILKDRAVRMHMGAPEVR